MDTKNPELMECPFCGSKDVYTDKDIGFDIYTTNDKDVIEENQHLDICRGCDAKRFRFERISMRDGKIPDIVSKWEENDPDLNKWMGW
jgi:hypothetical protein